MCFVKTGSKKFDRPNDFLKFGAPDAPFSAPYFERRDEFCFSPKEPFFMAALSF